MMKKCLILGILLTVVPEACIELCAQGKEELLFEEVPIDITAGRKEQPITEAPATVFVITSEDIKQSGATSIPDILRMASE